MLFRSSIDIVVSPSGAVTAVSGTTVSVSPDGRRAAAGTRTYAPRDVAKDLPVRVRTAYRTADGAGTDPCSQFVRSLQTERAQGHNKETESGDQHSDSDLTGSGRLFPSLGQCSEKSHGNGCKSHHKERIERREIGRASCRERV